MTGKSVFSDKISAFKSLEKKGAFFADDFFRKNRFSEKKPHIHGHNVQPDQKVTKSLPPGSRRVCKKKRRALGLSCTVVALKSATICGFLGFGYNRFFVLYFSKNCSIDTPQAAGQTLSVGGGVRAGIIRIRISVLLEGFYCYISALIECQVRPADSDE